jgi:hypothetical protein
VPRPGVSFLAVTPGMSDTTVSLLVAIISSIVALTSLAWQARTQRAQRAEDRAAEAERLVRRYTEPVVYAADQLVSRVDNMLNTQFLRQYGATRREHVVHSTTFAVAELLGWMELLRQDQQFVGLGEEDSTRRLNEALARIGFTFSTNTITGPDGRAAPLMLWRQDQRAIGEVMIDWHEGSGRCLGFARFVERLEDDAGFRRWFDRLLADVEATVDDHEPARPRLTALRDAAKGLLDLLDPNEVRVPRRPPPGQPACGDDATG